MGRVMSFGEIRLIDDRLDFVFLVGMFVGG